MNNLYAKAVIIRQKRGLFKTGMPLANAHDVKPRFTYKEFTMVLGVVVALIIVITMWMNHLHGGNINITEKPDSTSNVTMRPLKEILHQSVLQLRF